MYLPHLLDPHGPLLTTQEKEEDGLAARIAALEAENDVLKASASNESTLKAMVDSLLHEVETLREKTPDVEEDRNKASGTQY